jgi:hypothetical protein
MRRNATAAQELPKVGALRNPSKGIFVDWHCGAAAATL